MSGDGRTFERAEYSRRNTKRKSASINGSRGIENAKANRKARRQMGVIERETGMTADELAQLNAAMRASVRRRFGTGSRLAS